MYPAEISAVFRFALCAACLVAAAMALPTNGRKTDVDRARRSRQRDSSVVTIDESVGFNADRTEADAQPNHDVLSSGKNASPSGRRSLVAVIVSVFCSHFISSGFQYPDSDPPKLTVLNPQTCLCESTPATVDQPVLSGDCTWCPGSAKLYLVCGMSYLK